MRLLSNIDELKDLVTREYVNRMAGEHMMFPVYTSLSEDIPITEEQKAINKIAFDAYAECVARNFTEPYVSLYFADIGSGLPTIAFESVDSDGNVESIDILSYFDLHMEDYLNISDVIAKLYVAATLYPDGSVENYDLATQIIPTTNSFKTVNGQAILGTGNITIDSGGIKTESDPIFSASPAASISNADISKWNSKQDAITFDTAMSSNSTNAVQNKVIKQYIDDAIANIDVPEGGIASETDPIFSASAAAGITSSNISDWNNKVDKVSGKGLSTNDYTTAEKNKLAGIAEGAEVNVQSDWNATSGDAFIKNKPSLATVATSGSYNDLSNKPTIPSAVTESTVSGWGFTKNTGTYSKPSTGIPKSDLASSVQTSLGKADTTLQSYTEQYKGTVTGVKINGTTKTPSSGVIDLGTIPTTIDTSMSDSSTNSVQNKVIKTYVDSKVSTAGMIPRVARTETVFELTPNTMHVWGTITELTLTLKSVSSTYVQNYMFRFKTSGVQPTITLTGVKWLNGYNILENLEPNKEYEISIIDNLAVGGAFS